MSTSTNNAPALIAYQVTTGKDNKNFWHRIGAAWPNSKGGFQVRLNAVPLSGEIVLLPPADDSDDADTEE